MKNAIDISIIIPCYNMGKYLMEAIESCISSIEKSPYKIELIIVNDGSDDNGTIYKLQEIKELFPHIIIVNQENQGLAKARNNGIKTAKGKYILPLDADNKIRPNYINESIPVLDNHLSIDIIYGDKKLFGEKNEIIRVGAFNFLSLCKSNYIDACAVYRKSLWKKLNGYDENMPIMGYEDWDFWLRASTIGATFHYINKVCFEYRVRTNSMISETNKHYKTLITYMFHKKELKAVKLIRELNDEAEQYKLIVNSKKMKFCLKLFTLFIQKK